MVFPYSQKQIDELQEQTTSGAFVDKIQKRGVGNTKRPRLVIKDLDLKKWTKKMQFDKFLKNVLLNTKNMKCFQKERGATNPEKNSKRKPIWSIVSLIELYKPQLADDCRSDTHCINHLMTTNLVTKDNVKEIIKLVSELYDKVCFSDDVPSKINPEANARDAVIKSIRKHEWATNGFLTTLKPLMRLSDKRHLMLKNYQETTNLTQQKNLLQYSQYNLLEDVLKYKQIVDKKENGWVFYGMLFAQLILGTRWIEILVSKFSKSEINEFDPRVCVNQVGMAKDSSKSSRQYTRAYNDFQKNGGDSSKFESSLTVDQINDIEFVQEGSVVKPTLFIDHGIDSDYFINLVKDIRQVVHKELKAKHIEILNIGNEWLDLRVVLSNPVDRKKLGDIFYQRTTRAMIKFYGDDDRKVVTKRNKTHSMRKLYANYSYHMYGKNSYSMPSWYMKVLGHSNAAISFFYMVLVVKMGIKVEKLDVDKLLEMMAMMKTELRIVKNELETLKNTQANIKDLPRIGGGNVLVDHLSPDFNKKFDSDELKKTAFIQLLEELESEEVDITSAKFTQPKLMALGLSRATWRYLNKIRQNIIKEREEHKKGLERTRKRKRPDTGNIEEKANSSS